MTGPTVQVPVSLLRELHDTLGFHVGYEHDLTQHVGDLLSQPTVSLPTREQIAMTIAKAEDADYWVDEIAAWEGREAWERDAYAAEAYPAMAYEDRKSFLRTADAVLALRSQPTPTVEPDHHLYRAVRLADGLVAGPWMPGERAQISDRNEWREEMSSDQGWIAVASAEPPRPEDMAPGTLFESDGNGYKVQPDGTLLLLGVGRLPALVVAASSIDSSTIRDVTPPKGD